MNQSFMKQVQKLEVYNNALTLALPALRAAGLTYTGDDLRSQVEAIGREFGLADLT